MERTSRSRQTITPCFSAGVERKIQDGALAQTVRVKTLLFCPLNPGLKARVIDVCFPDDMKP